MDFKNIFENCKDGLGFNIEYDLIAHIYNFYIRLIPSLSETKYMFASIKDNQPENVWFFTEKYIGKVKIEDYNFDFYSIQKRITKFSIKTSKDFNRVESLKSVSELTFTFETDLGIKETFEAESRDKRSYLTKLITEYFLVNLK